MTHLCTLSGPTVSWSKLHHPEDDILTVIDRYERPHKCKLRMVPESSARTVGECDLGHVQRPSIMSVQELTSFTGSGASPSAPSPDLPLAPPFFLGALPEPSAEQPIFNSNNLLINSCISGNLI